MELTSAISVKTRSSGRKSLREIGCLIAILGLCTLVGLAALTGTFIRPMLELWQSREWVATPCIITESRVASRTKSGSTTYSPDIKFHYTYDGQQYRSDEYGFFIYWSSSKRRAERIVQRYPLGQNAVCYVNPARPERAVLERDFTWDNLLGLFPLLFVVVGLGGIIWACRSFLGRRTPDKFAKRDQFPERAYPTTPDARFGAERYGHRESIFDDDDSDDEDDEGDEFLPQRGVPGPVTLRPESSRLASFLIVLFFGTFWNGITSIFVVQTAADFARGNPRWLMMLLLTPFVLIGVLLIVGIFHTFLSLFNPRPEITLSSGDLSLGDEVELRWRFIGSTRSIRNLQIRLKGIEKAVYRRGTSTHTDTHTFADILIVETDDPMRIAEGSEILKLPSDTMHSFTANHNEINWALSVVGSIAFWPDIKDTFPIVIHPAPPRA